MEIDEHYERCLDGDGSSAITPTHAYKYAQSPFSAWCEFHALEEEKDSIEEFEQMLFEEGQRHERELIDQQYPDIEPIEFESDREGFRYTLEFMESGGNAFNGAPLFYLPEHLRGRADLIEKEDSGSSRFGPYHYVVKEIKSAKNIEDHHRLQAGLTNYLLGQVQDYVPNTYFVINRNREEFAFQHDEQEIQDLLQELEAIRDGRDVPPVYGAGVAPWESYCDKKAKEAGDVSLVSQVGPNTRENLAEAGYTTVDDLARAEQQALEKIHGIGPATSEKLVRNARALRDGDHRQIGSVSLPESDVEIFLDLEGTANQTRDGEIIDMDYLIGCLKRESGEEEFVPFVADTPGDEGTMFHEFADWLKQFDDVTIYHWHHYENWRLKRMAKNYGLQEPLKSKLFDNLVDLHSRASDAFVFPTHGNGLKEIAPYVGFEWRQEDVSATESIAMYFKYVEDPEENAELMGKIKDYNEDDCIATREIKDWMKRAKS